MSTSESSAASKTSKTIHRNETERVFDTMRRSRTETRRPMVFERLWEERHAEPDGGFVVKSNAYERALLKYAAMQTGETVHGMVRRLAVEAALKLAVGVEG